MSWAGKKTAPLNIEAEIEKIKKERDIVQAEFNKYQKVFNDEIRGVRTGTVGIGPVARAIQRNELDWRREEINRFNTQIDELTKRRRKMAIDIKGEPKKLLLQSAMDQMKDASVELKQLLNERGKTRGTAEEKLNAKIVAATEKLAQLQKQYQEIKGAEGDR